MGQVGSLCCALDNPQNEGSVPGESLPKLAIVGSASTDFLKGVPILRNLKVQELTSLAEQAMPLAFDNGTAVVTQGDAGDAFYLIEEGITDVIIDGQKVANLKTGDFFGEAAILRDKPRNATIKANGRVVVLRISRENFLQLGLKSKLEFPKRAAVGGGGGGNTAAKAAVKPPSRKTSDEEALISTALKKNVNLATMTTIDDAKIRAMSAVMWKEEVVAGTNIITEGDLQADYFYIVQSGSFGISKKDKSSDKQLALGNVAPQGSFGELALLYSAPRAASITASTDGVVWVTARHQFKDILLMSTRLEAKEFLKHVERTQVFSKLKKEEKSKLAEALQVMTFSKNDLILEQGEKGRKLYLLIEGEVMATKDGKEDMMKATASTTPSFGNATLAEGVPQEATIKVVSDSAKALWVDAKSFEILFGSLGQLAGAKVPQAPEKKQQSARKPSKEANRIYFRDLKELGLLGCGGFGAVSLVEDTRTGNMYALKQLSKGYVVKTKMESSVICEKEVQMMCDSPFIIRLYETFNSKQSLYLLLEIAIGGELYSTYNRKQLWGNSACCKFYVAGTALAFEHMHARKIIYRDLKPENILMNETGQVKLTDMGLAKISVGKTFTTCGTPEYFAPEVIASIGHTHAVDWWTLGILTFELMTGGPPFEGRTPMLMYAEINKGIDKVKFPKMDQRISTFVKSLCHAVASERLPMKKGGFQNIKDHEFFTRFSWEDMESLKMKAPYIPSVKSPKDKSNFFTSEDEIPPQIPYTDPGTNWDKDFATST